MTADALGIRRGPPGISEHMAFLPPKTVLRKRLGGQLQTVGSERLAASICASEWLVGEETWVGGQQHCLQQGSQDFSTLQNPSVLIKTEILFSSLKIS